MVFEINYVVSAARMLAAIGFVMNYCCVLERCACAANGTGYYLGETKWVW